MKKKLSVYEVMDLSVPRETKEERLVRLNNLLAEELKCKFPSETYINDLQESIKQLKKITGE